MHLIFLTYSELSLSREKKTFHKRNNFYNIYKMQNNYINIKHQVKNIKKHDAPLSDNVLFLKNNRLSCLPPSEIENLPSSEIENLPPSEIENLPSSEIENLPPSEIENLPPSENKKNKNLSPSENKKNKNLSPSEIEIEEEGLYEAVVILDSDRIYKPNAFKEQRGVDEIKNLYISHPIDGPLNTPKSPSSGINLKVIFVFLIFLGPLLYHWIKSIIDKFKRM